MPSKWAYIFGNSCSGPGSPYNQRSILYQLQGYFITDIGIIGDYIKYGIVFVLAGIFLLLKAIFFKTTLEFQFLKYYIFSQCFTLLTGYGIFGGVDIILLLILYIFDIQRAESISMSTYKSNELKYVF